MIGMRGDALTDRVLNRSGMQETQQLQQQSLLRLSDLHSTERQSLDAVAGLRKEVKDEMTSLLRVVGLMHESITIMMNKVMQLDIHAKSGNNTETAPSQASTPGTGGRLQGTTDDHPIIKPRLASARRPSNPYMTSANNTSISIPQQQLPIDTSTPVAPLRTLRSAMKNRGARLTSGNGFYTGKGEGHGGNTGTLTCSAPELYTNKVATSKLMVPPRQKLSSDTILVVQQLQHKTGVDLLIGSSKPIGAGGWGGMKDGVLPPMPSSTFHGKGN